MRADAKGAGPEEQGYLLLRPPDARALLVLAHGAGAGMRHPFLEAAAEALAAEAVATFRYEFPYMAAGRKLPDRMPVLVPSVREAVAAAANCAPDLPLFAGGKSMGGRATAIAQADRPLPPVTGLVFFGFPLHRAGRPGVERAEPLRSVGVPMLFLQGTRDRLAEIERMRDVCRSLGGRATLHEIADADHSFHVLKRTGRTDAEVIRAIARRIADWMRCVSDEGSRV